MDDQLTDAELDAISDDNRPTGVATFDVTLTRAEARQIARLRLDQPIDLVLTEQGTEALQKAVNP